MKTWLTQGSSGRQAVADPGEEARPPPHKKFWDRPPSPPPPLHPLHPLASHPSTQDKFPPSKRVLRYTKKLSTYLDSINRPVMLWKWAHNLFWWRFSFPITGEHRPLLCSNHKFGRHCGFKFQWHASLWTGIFLGIWTQWERFCWFTHFTYVPPKNLPVCAGWETLSTWEEILGLD